MMWKRTAAALLSGAMTLGLLTGCGGAPSASSGSGAASAPAAAEGMDKSDTLMRTDEDCNPQCDLATDYQVSDDLLEYTFTLRDGVKFHDGTDLTVEDVIFTIKAVMEDQTNSALREDFSLWTKWRRWTAPP